MFFRALKTKHNSLPMHTWETYVQTHLSRPLCSRQTISSLHTKSLRQTNTSTICHSNSSHLEIYYSFTHFSKPGHITFLCESCSDYLTSGPLLFPLNSYSSYGSTQLGANGWWSCFIAFCIYDLAPLIYWSFLRTASMSMVHSVIPSLSWWICSNQG